MTKYDEKMMCLYISRLLYPICHSYESMLVTNTDALFFSGVFSLPKSG